MPGPHDVLLIEDADSDTLTIPRPAVSLVRPNTGAKTLAPSTLWLVPLPPPYAGPEIVSQLLYETYSNINPSAVCLNASVRSQNTRKGRLDFEGIAGVLTVYARFVAALLRCRPRLVYLLLASNPVAFLRDAVYVLTARLFGRRVIAHYHGANFGGFYERQSRLLQWVIRFVLARIYTVIVLAHSLKPMFRDILPTLRVEVLYN